MWMEAQYGRGRFLAGGSEMGQIVQWQTGQGWIAGWSRDDHAMMIDQWRFA